MPNACLLEFQKLKKSDLVALMPYLAGKDPIVCDYSLLYFHMWNGFLRTEYAIDEDVLYLRRNTRHGIFYYPPLVRGLQDLLAGIPLLGRACEGATVELCALPEWALEQAQARFTVLKKETSRRWADYVYAAEDLATLRGHRYNKKRNLVHQFERLYPDHTYEELGEGNLAEVREFLTRMLENGEYTEDERYENERVLDVLADYDKLPLCGGLVRVGGEIVSFSVGERLCSTLFVHIEKADRAYKGAYQYINYRFSREELAREPFTYINREDDTGDEGLRQAKLSYCPVHIMHKYQLTLKNDFGGQRS